MTNHLFLILAAILFHQLQNSEVLEVPYVRSIAGLGRTYVLTATIFPKPIPLVQPNLNFRINFCLDRKEVVFQFNPRVITDDRGTRYEIVMNSEFIINPPSGTDRQWSKEITILFYGREDFPFQGGKSSMKLEFKTANKSHISIHCASSNDEQISTGNNRTWYYDVLEAYYNVARQKNMETYNRMIRPEYARTAEVQGDVELVSLDYSLPD